MLLCGSKHMQHSVSTTVEKTSRLSRDIERGTAAATAEVFCTAGTTSVSDGGRSLSGDKRTADSDAMALAIRATRPWGCEATYGVWFKGRETALGTAERGARARGTTLLWLWPVPRACLRLVVILRGWYDARNDGSGIEILGKLPG